MVSKLVVESKFPRIYEVFPKQNLSVHWIRNERDCNILKILKIIKAQIYLSTIISIMIRNMFFNKKLIHVIIEHNWIFNLIYFRYYILLTFALIANFQVFKGSDAWISKYTIRSSDSTGSFPIASSFNFKRRMPCFTTCSPYRSMSTRMSISSPIHCRDHMNSSVSPTT